LHFGEAGAEATRSLPLPIAPNQGFSNLINH